MEKFTTLTGVAAPLPLGNVDTDKIIPARFLKTIKRTGLGKHLFDTLRFDTEGNERPEFVLNQPQYRHAEILIAYDNFGCGSSREHAPWALLDDPFRKHTLLNGLDDIAQTMQHAPQIDAFEQRRTAAQPWLPALSAG